MPAHCVPSSRRSARARGILAALSAALLAGACSSGGALDSLDNFLASSQPSADASSAGTGQQPPRTELDRAIAHWAAEHKKQPHDLKAALAYARNLKAAGHKDQAFAVLQGAAILHGDSKELASEYGRLALEYDQVAVAEKLLAMADDPIKPDWKLTSALGTVMAKQGRYAEAIPYYERALAISPGQSSVLNNLAMAHAAGGQPAQAEKLLRDASARSNDPRIKQNLALVLGLQGRHDEAEGAFCKAALPGAMTLGVEILLHESELNVSFDTIFIDSGSGMTASGLLHFFRAAGIEKQVQIYLAAGNEEQFEATHHLTGKWLEEGFGRFNSGSESPNFLNRDSGKFTGKLSKEKLKFIQTFAREQGILLDPFYNAGLFQSAIEKITQKREAEKVLIIHSGGVSSLLGYPEFLQND